MKAHFTSFAMVLTVIFVALGSLQAYNIVRYGIESVPLVLDDALAGAVREQRQYLAMYRATSEPDSLVMQAPKKKK